MFGELHMLCVGHFHSVGVRISASVMDVGWIHIKECFGRIISLKHFKCWRILDLNPLQALHNLSKPFN